MPTSNGPARLLIGRPTLRIVWPGQLERSLRDRRLATLSAEEAEQYRAMPVEARRRDWLAGRLAAKLAVRDVMRRCGSAPALRSIVIANDESGAPSFVVDGRGDRELGLNLSLAHAGGVALAAVADTAQCGMVGVDVELDRALARQRLRSVLTAREWRALKTGDPMLVPSPLLLWMLKEAVFKADRGETFVAPWLVELQWRAGRIRVRRPPATSVRSRYRLSFRSHTGVVIACAVRSLSETS